MTRIAQLVRTSPDNIILLFGFNTKGELLFRSSRMPKYLQNEPIVIDKGMVYTNLYNFSETYLRNLPVYEDHAA